MQRSDYKIKRQVLIRGPNRETTGHPYYFCVKRGWSKNWTQVNIVEGKQNPVEDFVINEKTHERGVRPILDMITEEQLEQIMQPPHDGFMSIRNISEGTEEGESPKIDVVGLIGEKAKLESENASLRSEIDRLKLKLSETTAMLEEATRPAIALAKKVAARGR